MNHSPQLDRPLRTFEQMVAFYSREAAKLRNQVRQAVITLKRGHMPVWTHNYTVDCIKSARKAHTKTIANREAYKAVIINMREIQRSLRL